MTSTRISLGLFLLVLATSCVTTTVPVPEPPVQVFGEGAQPLIEVGAEHSAFLDVSSGYDNESASVGGDTGVRNAWFRFSANAPGDAVVTLTPLGDTSLTLALYDDSVVRDPARASEIGYRLATSSPDSIPADVQKGVYYVQIACGPKAKHTDFVVSVTYRPEPPPAKAPARVVTRPPVRPPRVVTKTVPKPLPPPSPPVEPVAPEQTGVSAPHVLIAPERREAVPLSSGTSATTDIGGESGYRWRWYEVTLTRKGKLRMDVTANGAPVEVELFDEKGKSVGKLDVTSTATHSARHSAGKLFIRVGPAANDEAARVAVDLKVAVAPFIRE